MESYKIFFEREYHSPVADNWEADALFLPIPEVEELVPEAELLPALSVKEDESPLRFPELPESKNGH